MERIKETEITAKEVVSYSNGTISLNQASQWLNAYERGETISKPVLTMLWLMCERKQMGFFAHNADYSHSQIVKKSTSLDDYLHCGVYFLIQKGSIVYVGQSIKVAARVSIHCSNFEFDSISVIKTDKSDLLPVESHYIKKFKPLYNRSQNTECKEPKALKASKEKFTPKPKQGKLLIELPLYVAEPKRQIPEPEKEQSKVDAQPTTDYVNIMNGSFIKKGEFIYFRTNKNTYKATFNDLGVYTVLIESVLKEFEVKENTSFGTFRLH